MHCIISFDALNAKLYRGNILLLEDNLTNWVLEHNLREQIFCKTEPKIAIKLTKPIWCMQFNEWWSRYDRFWLANYNGFAELSGLVHIRCSSSVIALVHLIAFELCVCVCVFACVCVFTFLDVGGFVDIHFVLHYYFFVKYVDSLYGWSNMYANETLCPTEI